MNGQGSDRLYKLLPELYRWRDESRGQSLRIFLALIEQELEVLETDIAAMYENWFIQTCEDWVVPYIAELLSIRNAAHGDQLPFTQRRRVANTLAYRRRSGTISVLEQVMWDVTNWHVSACEFGQCLAMTSHLRHSAAATAGTVRIRDKVAAAEINDPLTRLARTADMRRPNVRPLPPHAAPAAQSSTALGATDGQPAPVADIECEALDVTTDLTKASQMAGRYSASTIGLFFWRLRSYPVTRSRPYNVCYDPASGVAYYTFRPDGRDAPLFNRLQPFKSITQLAQRANLPVPITRLQLDADLQLANKEAQKEPSQPANSQYYGPERSLHIICNAANDGQPGERPITAQEVVCARLGQGSAYAGGDWPDPNDLVALATSLNEAACAVVDPQRGRLAVLLKASSEAKKSHALDFSRPDQVLVNYTYAFSGEIGGGQYARQPNIDQIDLAAGDVCAIDIVAGSKPSTSTADKYSGRLIANSLPCALRLWSSYCREILAAAVAAPITPRGLIRILDSGTYPVSDAASAGSTPAASAEDPGSIWLPTNSKLAIIAINGAQPTLRARAGALNGGHKGHKGVRVIFDDPWSSYASAQRRAMAALAGVPDGEATAPVVTDRWLYLSGLRLMGSLELVESWRESMNLLDIRIEDCTLDGGIRADMGRNARSLSIEMVRSISGPLLAPPTAAGVKIYDSIVDNCLCLDGESGTYAIAGATAKEGDPTGPPLTIVRSTVFGEVAVRRLDLAEAVIFTQQLCVADQAQGFVRFSFVPDGSQTPHHCERNLHGGSLAGRCCDACCRSNIAAPSFTSRRYGRPGYGQLSARSAPEFRHWIGDGGEIGAFHNLYQPQREVNIRQVADEYLPAGFDLDVFYVT